MSKSNRISQAYLDSTQYAESSIQHYEAIYGDDFISPGGYAMAKELICQFDRTIIHTILDVGCGLGGSAFVMAREFGFSVDGIDLSKNMLAIANEKLKNYQLTDWINFKWGDCLELDVVAGYDAIYSRDVFLHIGDKPRLFKVLNRALSSGGRLLFTDYCCGPKPWHENFTRYVDDRKYTLHTLPDYVEFVKQAGFEQIEYEDMTARFIQIMKQDLEKVAGLDLAAAVREKLQQSWQEKITRAQMGDHRWGLITAIKP